MKMDFTAGLVFGVVRFVACGLNTGSGLLIGVLLHGCSYTLIYVTAQIYLDQRVDSSWRARAQALMALMSSGVGSLAGYLGIGGWFNGCTTNNITNWQLFWNGLALVVALVLIYFLVAYHGIGAKRANQSNDPSRGQ